jgi:hypothetical protein
MSYFTTHAEYLARKQYITATIKLDGKMVTPEQAAAEWESKKEACDVWVNQMLYVREDSPRFTDTEAIYELRPKALKKISWRAIPAGVMTNKGELRGTFLDNGADIEIRAKDGSAERIVHISQNELTLSPASEQPWVVVKKEALTALNNAGITYDWSWTNTMGVVIFKITGVAEGYVLGGAV